jgi:hypothetical protein
MPVTPAASEHARLHLAASGWERNCSHLNIEMKLSFLSCHSRYIKFSKS